MLEISGAGSRVRTRDPLITNQVLYQLSYTGTRCGHLALTPLLSNLETSDSGGEQTGTVALAAAPGILAGGGTGMRLGVKRVGASDRAAKAPVDLRRILAQKLGRNTFSPEAIRFFELVQEDAATTSPNRKD